MSLFENGAVRDPHYLLTISPKNLEAEGAFPAAGFIVNKMRSLFGDDTIDASIFFMSYFQRVTD